MPFGALYVCHQPYQHTSVHPTAYVITFHFPPVRRSNPCTLLSNIPASTSSANIERRKSGSAPPGVFSDPYIKAHVPCTRRWPAVNTIGCFMSRSTGARSVSRRTLRSREPLSGSYAVCAEVVPQSKITRLSTDIRFRFIVPMRQRLFRSRSTLRRNVRRLSGIY